MNYRRNPFRTPLLAVLTLGLAACSGLFPTPSATLTASPSPSQTTTVEWFPPTNTPTPLPSVTILPTPEMRPGLGPQLLADSFDDPGQWSLSSSNWTSATISLGRLVLSINGPGPLEILSLRRAPVLDDFYAETLVSLSLCQAGDEFGLLFRAAPGQNYYRFTVSCAGLTRLERVRSGVTNPLTDWLPSGDAPLGAPAEVRLGVWAVGGELRFFLNDHYQFNRHDLVFHTGTLGFFAQAAGESPLAVSFSDLAAYTVSYLSPTPSSTPTRLP
jgi:hypothetical protein